MKYVLLPIDGRKSTQDKRSLLRTSLAAVEWCTREEISLT